MVVGDGGAHRDVLERLREGQLSRLVDRPLQQPHGHLRALGELLSQLDGPLEQLTRLDDLMDEAELEGLGGGHDPLAHEEVHGAGHAEVLDEQVVAALVR